MTQIADDVYEAEDGTGRKFRRLGTCTNCGECCIGCPINALVFENGKSRCTQRTSKYYLSGCNVWPTSPEQIRDKPNCGYTFEEVRDGD